MRTADVCLRHHTEGIATTSLRLCSFKNTKKKGNYIPRAHLTSYSYLTAPPFLLFFC
jgi:hypothetical protein